MLKNKNDQAVILNTSPRNMYSNNKFEARDQLKDHYHYIQQQKNNIQDRFSIKKMEQIYKPDDLASVG